jgi:ATP-binding cassette, subfamily C, bacterial
MLLDKESVGLVRYFLKAYPRRSALIVLLLFLSGLAEGIGVVSLLPLLEVAVHEAGDESRLMVHLRRGLGELGLEPTIGVLLSIIVAGMFLKGAFLWLAQREVGYMVARVATDLRLSLIRALLRARWAYFVNQPLGHVSNAIGSEAHRASHAYGATCNLLAAAVQAAIYVGVALLISPLVALFALLGGALISLLMGGLVRLSRRAGKHQTNLIKSLARRLTDALQGIKPIKAMGQERQFRPLLEAETQALNAAQQRQVIASGTLNAFQEPLLVALLAIGLYAVLSWGNEPLSSLLVMAFLFQRLVGRVQQVQAHYQTMASSESAFWSLRRSAELAEAEQEVSTGKQPAPALTEGVRLHGISFGYDRNEVLRQIELFIPAGKFVAIAGPSGAGKTTIADLIIGLYRPWTGEVLVDGVPLGEIKLSAWRGLIGYVPQEMLLFHDSVLRNVTLGDEAVSRDAVQQALTAAGAWDFVSGLPNGMDTVIGERGTKLSGGQRQRIAIARALVRTPKLLVLDEVTTSLDPRTEAAICETLRELRGLVTIVAISHQPAMMEVADVVYWAEDGQVSALSALPRPTPSSPAAV